MLFRSNLHLREAMVTGLVVEGDFASDHALMRGEDAAWGAADGTTGSETGCDRFRAGSATNASIAAAPPWEPSHGPLGRVIGVRTYFGSVYSAGAVILTTGTFLGGRIWVGERSMAAGRAGEQAAEGLTEALAALGFQTGRLKTGTPARVDRRSIALDQLEEQPSDAHDRYFSFDPASWVSGEPMSCHIKIGRAHV